MLRLTSIAILATVLALLAAAAAGAARPRSLLVAVEPGAAAGGVIEDQGGRLVSKALGIWELGAGAAQRVVPAFARGGLLRYSEPNRLRAPAAIATDDPLLPGAWQLARVGATRATPPGPGVPITIVDGGILLDYPELAGRPDVTAVNEQPTQADQVTAHGTEIAALAAAPANGVGTVGVYPRAAIASYTLAGFDDASIVAGLDAVVTRGPSVINLSLGGPGFGQALYEAILRAVNAGCIVVASAGNSRTGTARDFYPADYPHVLTVGSTTRDDAPSSFSIRSRFVDVAAPGEELHVLDPLRPSQTVEVRGTSFSTPIVSAAAAWLWSARPELAASQVTELLRRRADDVAARGFDRATGFGIPFLPAALDAPVPAADPEEPNDDVSQVVAGGLFPDAKPAFEGTVQARVDRSEDPRDLYRLVIPGGATARLSLKPKGNLALTLWSPDTTSVTAGAGGHRRRLAFSNRKGSAVERVTWKNSTASPAVVFVEVSPPAANGATRARYALTASSGQTLDRKLPGNRATAG